MKVTSGATFNNIHLILLRFVECV